MLSLLSYVVVVVVLVDKYVMCILFVGSFSDHMRCFAEAAAASVIVVVLVFGVVLDVVGCFGFSRWVR